MILLSLQRNYLGFPEIIAAGYSTCNKKDLDQIPWFAVSPQVYSVTARGLGQDPSRCTVKSLSESFDTSRSELNVHVLCAVLKHVPSWNMFQIGMVCRSEK